jgi:hypothetical protein
MARLLGVVVSEVRVPVWTRRAKDRRRKNGYVPDTASALDRDSGGDDTGRQILPTPL